MMKQGHGPIIGIGYLIVAIGLLYVAVTQDSLLVTIITAVAGGALIEEGIEDLR